MRKCYNYIFVLNVFLFSSFCWAEELLDADLKLLMKISPHAEEYREDVRSTLEANTKTIIVSSLGKIIYPKDGLIDNKVFLDPVTKKYRSVLDSATFESEKDNIFFKELYSCFDKSSGEGHYKPTIIYGVSFVNSKNEIFYVSTIALKKGTLDVVFPRGLDFPNCLILSSFVKTAIYKKLPISNEQKVYASEGIPIKIINEEIDKHWKK